MITSLLLACAPNPARDDSGETLPVPELSVGEGVSERVVPTTRVTVPATVVSAGGVVEWTEPGAVLLAAPSGPGQVYRAKPSESAEASQVPTLLDEGRSGAELGAALSSRSPEGVWAEALVAGGPGADEVRVYGAGGTYVSWEPATMGERLGATVVNADLDGDGLLDLLAGAPDASRSRTHGGVVYVVLGERVGVGGSLADADVEVAGEWRDAHLGAVLTVLDTDIDGTPDIVVGVPELHQVYFYSGAEVLAGGAVEWMGGISLEMDAFGSVLAASDTAAGGPLLVAAPPDSIGGVGLYATPLPAGMVDGTDAVRIGGFGDISDGSPVAEFGASASLADLNGDGLFDVTLGFPGVSGFGFALQEADSTEGWPFADPVIFRSSMPDRTGASVSPGPDQDGDGFSELLVGAPAGADGSGYAWVVWSGGLSSE